MVNMMMTTMKMIADDDDNHVAVNLHVFYIKNDNRHHVLCFKTFKSTACVHNVIYAQPYVQQICMLACVA